MTNSRTMSHSFHETLQIFRRFIGFPGGKNPVDFPGFVEVLDTLTLICGPFVDGANYTAARPINLWHPPRHMCNLQRFVQRRIRTAEKLAKQQQNDVGHLLWNNAFNAERLYPV